MPVQKTKNFWLGDEWLCQLGICHHHPRRDLQSIFCCGRCRRPEEVFLNTSKYFITVSEKTPHWITFLLLSLKRGSVKLNWVSTFLGKDLPEIMSFNFRPAIQHFKSKSSAGGPPDLQHSTVNTPVPEVPMGAVRILNRKLKSARSNSPIISRIRTNDCLFHQGQHSFSRDYLKISDFSCFLAENSI